MKDRLPAPQLEVKDLRVVAAIGRQGTTAAAAEVLHLTQSAVSRALAVAESRAGVALFERTAKGLVPTAAGARILDAAPALLAELSALERELRAPAAPPAEIRFAAECYMAYPWVSQMVVRLRRHGVRVRLCVDRSADAGAALATGELDAAMLLGPPPAGVPSRPMFRDEMMFLVGPEHPLAGAEHLRPRDVAAHRLLVPTARASDTWFMRRVFGSRRPRLQVERLPITEAIVELARAGVGVAVLSEWVAAPYLGGRQPPLRAIRLRGGPLLRPWRLAHRSGLGATGDWLAEALADACSLAGRGSSPPAP